MPIPTIDALLADPCNTVYTLLESIAASNDPVPVESALDLLEQVLTKKSDEHHESFIPSQLAIAVGLFSILNKNQTNSDVSKLLRSLTNRNPRFLQALVEHVPFHPKQQDPTPTQPSLLESLLPEDVLQKKIRQTNTTLYCRQHKFSLLAEESEGFSKLLLALYTGERPTTIDSIIGTFSLDPVRCLDISVDCLTYVLSLERTDNGKKVERLMSSAAVCDIIRPLAAGTNKLPQLLGFQLRRGESPPDLLPTISHLLQQQPPILDLATLLLYLPDDSHRWADIVNTTVTKVAEHEWKRLRALGRVRLSKKSDSDSPPPDLSPVTSLYVIQCILRLPSSCWDKIVAPLLEDWSGMAILFPKTIGVAILDSLAMQLESLGPVEPPPWSNTTKTPAEQLTLSKFLDVVMEPLDTVRESGCIQFRPELYVTLCRLLATIPAEEKTSERLLQFIGSFLLPSLSAFPPNPAMNQEVWTVIAKLPYQDRYRLYDTWQASTSHLLWLAEAQVQVLKDAKYALRRLAKDTVRELSRNIAKCCFRYPIVVFTTILNQIESYNNLIQVMIEACRFVGPLGWDVLGFGILQRLTAAGRDRFKESGVYASQWLQSLEQFTGAFYKRYPAVEVLGLVKYLRTRLEAGEVVELGMLQALITTAGGWGFRHSAPTASLTEDQLNGMAGSIMLQRQTAAFGIVEGIDWRAAKQMQTVLRKDGVDLLIFMAQVRYHILYKASDNKPVKLVGKQLDDCQVLRALLLDFLTNDQVEESASKSYLQRLPTIQELLEEYKMEPEAAWQLSRPILASSAERCPEATCQSMVPTSTWTHMNVALYQTFWSYAPYDIYHPSSMYENEISRLETEVSSIKREVESLGHKVKSSHEDRFVLEERKLDMEEKLKHIQRVVAELKKDQTKQQSHRDRIVEQIKSKTTCYFVSKESSIAAMMTFFTRCIYPRSMQGPCDAFYCAKFIELLQHNNTPGFGLVHLYDCLIPVVSRALYGMTEGEAAWASILFADVWKNASSYRYDESAFEAQFAASSISSEEYKALFNKWHASLSATCLGCLESKEYIHLRNCLTLLTRIVEVFPTKPTVGNKLLLALDPLQAEGFAMADIRAAATAYSSQLKHARDKGAWKEEGRAAVLERENELKAKHAEKQKRYAAASEKDPDPTEQNVGDQDVRDGGRNQRRSNDADRSRGPGDRWQRDRGQSNRPPDRRDERRRDERDQNASRSDTRKRSRPPSPLEQGETGEDGKQTQQNQTAERKEPDAEETARRPRQRRRGGGRR